MEKALLSICLLLTWMGYAGGVGADYRISLQPTDPACIVGDPDHYTWGASPMKGRDGRYHLFYSRWKKEEGFSAWLTGSEVAHAVSESVEGPYRFRDVALPARGKRYWDGLNTHNPTIHCFDGKYYLYYMGTTGDGKNTEPKLNMNHRNSQRIGVAVAASPDGPWTRWDKPLIDVSSDPQAPDALMTSNPSVTRMPDGRFLMVYKAVGKKVKGIFGGPVVHLCATSDSPMGPFKKELKPIFTKKGTLFAAEDPYIWCQDGLFYAIVKDMRGTFTYAGRSLALFFSENGLDWQPAAEPLITRPVIHWRDGSSNRLKLLDRPQLLLENGKPTHIFLAAFPDESNREGLPPYPTFNIHFPLIQK